MMWKDFFYYSKGERRAVYLLMVLIALLLLAIILMPENKPMVEPKVSFVDSLKSEKPRTNFQVKAVSYHLKEFNPNLADSIELSSLGLPAYVVRNVLKYRQKGGRFSTAESFARIYGLSAEKFNELKPYIRIPEIPKKKTARKEMVDSVVKPLRSKAFKYPEGTLVDVNVADTTELKKIPGIGSGIAKAIVAYRERLGGFYSLEQLSEIDYITPALMVWFKLEEQPSVRQLKINVAGLDKLRAHPYLNFYQAKTIVEHRKKRGPIKNLSQLSLYEEFTEKDLKRLSAYVSFD